MPLQFKAPPRVVTKTPVDATGLKRPATPLLLADQPHAAYQSPLVDALLAQMRQARARRQTPH